MYNNVNCQVRIEQPKEGTVLMVWSPNNSTIVIIHVVTLILYNSIIFFFFFFFFFNRDRDHNYNDCHNDCRWFTFDTLTRARFPENFYGNIITGYK